MVAVCALFATGVAAAKPGPGQACVAKKNAVYKKSGLRCVNGHLQRIAAPPHPTTTEDPVTTPAPTQIVAAAGHYTGRTSQGYSVSFDVQPDIKNLTNIVGGQIDQTCTPAGTWSFPGFATGGYDYPMGTTFTWRLPNGAGSRVEQNGVVSHTQIKMTAEWSDPSHASGSYTIHTSFDGKPDTCDTEVVFSVSHA